MQKGTDLAGEAAGSHSSPTAVQGGGFQAFRHGACLKRAPSPSAVILQVTKRMANHL